MEVHTSTSLICSRHGHVQFQTAFTFLMNNLSRSIPTSNTVERCKSHIGALIHPFGVSGPPFQHSTPTTIFGVVLGDLNASKQRADTVAFGSIVARHLILPNCMSTLRGSTGNQFYLMWTDWNCAVSHSDGLNPPA